MPIKIFKVMMKESWVLVMRELVLGMNERGVLVMKESMMEQTVVTSSGEAVPFVITYLPFLHLALIHCTGIINSATKPGVLKINASLINNFFT